VAERDYYTVPVPKAAKPEWESPAALAGHIQALEGEMREAARRLDFERAAELRDRVRALRKVDLGVGRG
jgi:excinuclease ABC subunit B